MNPLIKKLSWFHYNIGFFPLSDEILYHGDVEINWLKHPFSDRFFADPFILDVADGFIKVLVEELLYNNCKGRISLLTIDASNYNLLNIKPLLDLQTHLSFPFIYRENNEVYVIPENSQSEELSIYYYDFSDDSLRFIRTMVSMPVIDPVLFHSDDSYILLGSLKHREENRDLFAWHSVDLFGDYNMISEVPVKRDYKSSRRGGGFFTMNSKLYSATQCCLNSYGEALNICEVEDISNGSFSEKVVRTLLPDKRYSYGLHTFNTHSDLCVVDGLTYLFNPVAKIRKFFKI